METLLELERNPRPWRKSLYVDPSSYAQIGGWIFDKEGQKIQLNFNTCYPMVKGTTGEKSPVRIPPGTGGYLSPLRRTHGGYIGAGRPG